MKLTVCLAPCVPRVGAVLAAGRQLRATLHGIVEGLALGQELLTPSLRSFLKKRKRNKFKIRLFFTASCMT